MRRVRPRDAAFASRPGGEEEEARARGEGDDHDETTGVDAREDEEFEGNEREIPHEIFKVRRRQHGRDCQGTHPRARAPSGRFPRTRTPTRVATTENGSRVFKMSIRRQRVRQVSRRARRGARALSSLGARLTSYCKTSRTLLCISSSNVQIHAHANDRLIDRLVYSSRRIKSSTSRERGGSTLSPLPVFFSRLSHRRQNA